MNAPFGIPSIGLSKAGRKERYGAHTALPFSPLVLGIGLVILIVFIGFFATISSYGSSSQSPSMGLVGLDVVLWGCLVFLVLVNGMAYLFNIDVVASIKGLFTSKPTVNLEVSGAPAPKGASPDRSPSGAREQVFHVSNNKYTYDNAKAICAAYGGRLATVKEMQTAYRAGADWCGYGWSDGQMALYPTQYEKWERLQEIPGHEHDCGRPGLNGGYIANPEVRFGANCYGMKPEADKDDLRAMRHTPLYPLTPEEVAFRKKVAKWRRKLGTLDISPFNSRRWNA